MSLSFIPSAMAATGSTNPQGETIQFILFLVVFAAFFYFFLIRPQNKRNQDHRNLISKLAVGDEVVTVGGILGRINKLNDDFISLTIAEGTEIIVQKAAIANSVPKGTMKSV